MNATSLAAGRLSPNLPFTSEASISRYDRHAFDEFSQRSARSQFPWVGTVGSTETGPMAPQVRDSVIVGHDRRYIAVRAVPSTPVIAENEAARARVFNKLTELATQATGSSQRVPRLSFLTRSLSIDTGEFTKKGSLSQRGIMRRHADLSEAPYADRQAANILCADLESLAAAVTNI